MPMFERSFDTESLARFAAVEGLSVIARLPLNERMQRVADLAARSLRVSGAIASYKHPRATWEHCGVGPFELHVQSFEPAWADDVGTTPTVLNRSDATPERPVGLASVAIRGLDDRVVGYLSVFDDTPLTHSEDELKGLLECAAWAETELRVQALHDNQTRLLEELFMARQQALQDSLTRLWNRQAMTNLLERELSRAQRQDTGTGLIFVDIDDFAALNEAHGRAAGDDVIQYITGVLSRAVRPYDALGRYGGEEFLILLPGCPAETTRQVAERMRLAVASEQVPTENGYVPVTISLGVATAAPGGLGSSPESLIKAADAAGFAAKQDGRNCVRTADKGDYFVA